MRFERMSGLDEEQLSELECLVAELLEEPWDKGEGRPRGLTLREALIVACGYLRQISSFRAPVERAVATVKA